MSDRDLARGIRNASYGAARESRAIRRGVVDSVQDDGRAVVILPNGAKVLRPVSPVHSASQGESVVMARNGGFEEVWATSAYGGGNGSAYDPGP